MHVTDIRLHFLGIKWQCPTIHASLHATVDSFFNGADVIFAWPVLGKYRRYTDEWNGIDKSSTFLMAGAACQIVSGITHFGIFDFRSNNGVSFVGEFFSVSNQTSVMVVR